ncbi:MAG: transglutaminase-like domain-containing protein [Hyphomicrobiales bacterium]|nr:transglutaminase-like domain-containing protein [Hyphomicrobiales bacterium]
MSTVLLRLAEPAIAPLRVIVALPFDTDRRRFLGHRVDGARVRRIAAHNGVQKALVLDVERPDELAVAFDFDDRPGAWDEGVFTPTGGRHETPSAELVATMSEIAPVDLPPHRRVERIVAHVETRFTYGTRAVGLGDDTAAMPVLACDVHLGTCVDTHSYAVAAMRAAGFSAAYVSGVFFPAGETEASPGHCWFVVRVGAEIQTWDVSHFLKYDLGPVRLVDDPKPGRRHALSAGRDLRFTIDGRVIEATRLSGFLALDAGAAQPLATRATVSSEA